jgi:sporulation protein YlmC with PRC-barrel domain
MVIAVTIVCASAVTRAQPSAPAADPGFVPEFLATDLIGRPVRSANGESVGEISDLVVSSAGSVTAAVVSVGGFLGIGGRRVEVSYDKLVVAANRNTVLVTMSKEQVTSKPDFATPEKPSEAPNGASQGAVTTPATPLPTQQPDAAARSEADREAAHSFATDDPRVAQGIAENKEAFDDKAASGARAR